jgi:hypothetical protein
MGTEVVSTLTHADAPQQGNAPHSVRSAPRPACVYHALQQIHMKLFFAGDTHVGQIRVRGQIRVTLKTPYD